MNENDLKLIYSTLRELEWSIWHESHLLCPVCYRGRNYGHSEDCTMTKSIMLVVKEINKI